MQDELVPENVELEKQKLRRTTQKKTLSLPTGYSTDVVLIVVALNNYV